MARRGTTVATFFAATAELARQLEIEDGARRDRPAGRMAWLRLPACAGARGDGAARGHRIQRRRGTDTRRRPERWGTAELQTDARVGRLIDYADGRSEAVLVNGDAGQRLAGARPGFAVAPRPMPAARRPAQWPRPCMRSRGWPGSGRKSLFERVKGLSLMCGIAGFADSLSRRGRTPEATSRSSTRCATSSGIAVRTMRACTSSPASASACAG